MMTAMMTVVMRRRRTRRRKRRRTRRKRRIRKCIGDRSIRHHEEREERNGLKR